MVNLLEDYDYFLLLELSIDGHHFITDACNSALERHGYTREELVGQPIAKLLTEEAKKRAVQNGALIKSGKAVRFETTHLRKDGTTFNVAVNAKMMAMGGRLVILTLERDITGARANGGLPAGN